MVVSEELNLAVFLSMHISSKSLQWLRLIQRVPDVKSLIDDIAVATPGDYYILVERKDGEEYQKYDYLKDIPVILKLCPLSI